jgi:hypothetical protein
MYLVSLWGLLWSFVLTLFNILHFQSRFDILKIHSRKMNLMRGIDLKKIAEKMNGASGAELKVCLVSTHNRQFMCIFLMQLVSPPWCLHLYQQKIKVMFGFV